MAKRDTDPGPAEDLSGGYQAVVNQRSTDADVAAAHEFMRNYNADAPEQVAPVAPADPLRPLPAGKPLRQKTDDPVGRIPVEKESTAGKVMRHASEVPNQAMAGVESAISNAMGWAINPLAEWLNENVADLSYDRAKPKTLTGNITKSMSEFFTGFIPALKAMRAVGAKDMILAPMAAGAFADFAARDPSEKRLSDIWKELDLPKNVLTDYLSSKPGDTEFESRFKNAIEGAGLGILAEGLFLAGRTIIAAKNVRGAKKAEQAYLKDKYGEITDEDFAKIIGDPSKPSVEMVVREPSKAGAKVAQGAADTANLTPRSLVTIEVPKVTQADIDAHVAAQGKGMSRRDFLKMAGAAAVNQIPGANLMGKLVTEGAVGVAKAVLARMSSWDAYNMYHMLTGDAATIAEEEFLLQANKLGLSEQAITAFSNAANKTRKLWDEWDEVAGSGTSANPINNVNLGLQFAEFAKNKGVNVGDMPAAPSMGFDGFSRVFAGVAEKEGLQFIDPVVVAENIRSLRKSDKYVRQVLKNRGIRTSELNSKNFNELEEILGEAATIKQVDEAKIAAKISEVNANREVYINFAKFDEPDEIKFAIGELADAGRGTINEATRGVITHTETLKLAEDLGMSVTELLARRKGEGFNAEQAVAARQLWAASAERLVEVAKIANSKNAGPVDLYAFRKHMAVHAAIQAEIIGARTETARALNAWKIPVKGGIERARAVDQVVGAMGGEANTRELARRLAILAEVNASPQAIARFAERGWAATSVDAVREVWINSLLSSPKTHVVNVASNIAVSFASIAERAVAGGIRSVTGGEGVQAMEAAAMAYGMVESVKDAFRLAAKALRTGETSWTFNKVDMPQTHAVSAEAFGASGAIGKAVDFLGTAVRIPTRLLGAEDEFFKTIGYRMELHAQALRQATQEGHRGRELGLRMAEIVQNPPEHIMINAADTALYNTFTNEVGAFGAWVMKGRNVDSPLNPAIFILPFVRTPVNIARYAFERTPFAPLVGQWRADIAAGGARADLALARMSMGTTMMLAAMDLADRGLITGPGFRGKDTPEAEAMQRQGLMPYSFKAGDRWYSYNRTDPFGMVLGFAASITEAVRKGEIDQEEVDEWYEVVGMSIAAVSQVTISKTYLEGFSNFIELMSEPRRHAQGYINNLLASFLPATSAMAALKNFVDPVARETSDPIEAVYARIAGMSNTLPPRRDLWGKELMNESGLGKMYDLLSPVQTKPMKDLPIDREMVRLNHGVSRIGKRTSFDGVDANMRHYPRAYDDYVRLAGNDLKHPAWGMGAKDYLDAVVSGKHPMSAQYNLLPDEGRKAFIDMTIRQYRTLAQREVLADPRHNGFAAEVQKLKDIHQQSRMPVTE